MIYNIVRKDRITEAYKRVMRLGSTHAQALSAVAVSLATDEMIVAEVIAEQPAGWLADAQEAASA